MSAKKYNMVLEFDEDTNAFILCGVKPTCYTIPASLEHLKIHAKHTNDYVWGANGEILVVTEGEFILCECCQEYKPYENSEPVKKSAKKSPQELMAARSIM